MALEFIYSEDVMANSSMLHVRIDDALKADAAEKLAAFGLTISDAVRILLTRVSKEGGLPAGLILEPDSYDVWFKEKVYQAINDQRPSISHDHVMEDIQSLLDRKRHDV